MLFAGFRPLKRGSFFYYMEVIMSKVNEFLFSSPKAGIFFLLQNSR